MATKKTVKAKKSWGEELQEKTIEQMFQLVQEGRIAAGEFAWWVRDRESTAWRSGASDGFER